MPSAAEPILPGNSPKVPRFRSGLERWNRKLHFYAGLFLLFFIWLFAFSGLLLNHPSWSFAESWNNRKETNYERQITAPGPEVKVTSLWAFSMDAVAAGLILMVLSSLYMWFDLPQKRVPGAVVLALGSLICGLFCVGLRWLL